MAEDKTLFLLDGMALAYRAHFALIRSPIRNSKGMITSAAYGFTQTLIDILDKQSPTHVAVAFDTSAPTPRHEVYPEYKAQREDMPEDLSAALPWIRQLLGGLRIPVIEKDGYEADDLIGTLAGQAAKEGFTVYMVTPDKDFGQLVSDRVKMWKPGRQGGEVEVLGPEEVCARWGIERVEQVIDILGLMGDASDNIPGVPGVGEKTAAKLVGQFGSVDELLKNTDQLKGKLKERVEGHADQARLSKQLATIMLDAPVGVKPAELIRGEMDQDALQETFRELEFNSLGKRLFGDDFQAGPVATGAAPAGGTGDLFASDPAVTPDATRTLKTLADLPHQFHTVTKVKEARELVKTLKEAGAFAFDTETDGLDPLQAGLVGLSFATSAEEGWFLPLSGESAGDAPLIDVLREVFTDQELTKIGHNLKFDLRMLLAHGIEVEGPFFDTMLAHALIEPEMRHGMDRLAGQFLGYEPIAISTLIGEDKNPARMREVPLDQLTDYAAEDAVITWQLHEIFRPLLKERQQEKVFYEIECPVLPVLVAMEHAGVLVDQSVLKELSKKLAEEGLAIAEAIEEDAGRPFNLNSPKQLGQVLFDELKLVEKPKKTKTGQYVTNEQVLESLAPFHPIVRRILEYREVTKLRSTYVDALPQAISPKDGRIHTTYHQAATATGRLASQNPNLQNIPIRSERGRAIRKAFVPEGQDTLLLAADYSQIELRIMAAMSGDGGLRQAFRDQMDIHTATAARVHDVDPEDVDADMRRSAKMVNFGIIYGISAFGLAQRLGIPRGEAARIIEAYFDQYPGVREYMDRTIAQCKETGYVETLTGRRRHLPDVRSGNGSVRAAAERNAINAPIQGTAADMIKLAMIRVDQGLKEAGVKTRMLLQVHDELVFEGPRSEEELVGPIILKAMQEALPLEDVPVEVEIGSGINWLEAH